MYVAGKRGHQSMLIKVHVTVLGVHWDPCTATDWLSYVIMHLKKCILLLYYKLTAVESMHKLSGYWNKKMTFDLNYLDNSSKWKLHIGMKLLDSTANSQKHLAIYKEYFACFKFCIFGKSK